MKVKTFPFIEQAHGMLKGTDYIFKTIRGRTYLSRKPKPSTKPETASQRNTRLKFKEGVTFVRSALTDAERNAYYVRMANKLNVPNAYTAALADYMRKPEIAVDTHPSTGTVSIEIKKKDFNIVNASINVKASEIIISDATRKIGKRIHIKVEKINIQKPLIVKVEDSLGQCLSYELGDL